MKYDIKITFKLNEPFDISYVNNVYLRNPGKKILVEVQNTKGITSRELRNINSNVHIRISGAYNDDRQRIYKNHTFGKEDCNSYYYESVIYTRNEAIKIIEEIENIEKGINDNWTEIQKIIYIYDKLKTEIMYDPKYEQKSSRDVRSLRGLITKQTVCAGYALILKEMLDRQKIKCYFVRGNGHAWNIVDINNKLYPVDLTWDNTKFRAGEYNSFDYLGQDVETFNKNHKPDKSEPLYGYQTKLSQINPDLIKLISMQIRRIREYKTTIYSGERKNGTKYIVAQIGNSIIQGNKYYEYYYADIINGKVQPPHILYSETNVTELINCKKFGKYVPPKLEETIDNILFSRENVSHSLYKNTCYIGSVEKNGQNNMTQYVNSFHEIAKPLEKRNMFAFQIKQFRRTDGTTFIAQLMSRQPFEINGVKLLRFDIYEVLNENGQPIIKRNTVFTEVNFFLDKRQSLVDDYLSRSRIDRKANEAGGYIGYYDKNGIRTYNPNLLTYFETSKKININDLKKEKVSIPDFNEIKLFASKYDVKNNSNNKEASNINVINIKTKKVETEPLIIYKAILANIWLSSAGIRWNKNEPRPGFIHAFSRESEELYNIILKVLYNQAKIKGIINPIELFKNIDSMSSNKYSKKIIVNLFKNEYQTQFINSIILKSMGLNKSGITPEPLYSMNNAINKINLNKNSGKI